MTAAHHAARNGQVQLLDVLLVSNPNALAAIDKDGLTPFLTACACGQISVVDWLLTKCITNGHDREPKTGATGLHLATVRHHTNAVTFLVARVPALVLATTIDNATAIRIAAEAGYLDIVTVLLNQGADPTQRDDSGMSALTAAEHYGRLDVATLIHTRLPSKLVSYSRQNQPDVCFNVVVDDLQNPMPVLGLEASALDMDIPLDLASLTSPRGLERMSEDFNLALPPMGLPEGFSSWNPSLEPPHTLGQQQQQQQLQQQLQQLQQQQQQQQQQQMLHSMQATSLAQACIQPSLAFNSSIPLDPRSHPASLRTIRQKSSFEDPDSPMDTIPLQVPDLNLEDVDGNLNPALDPAFLMSQFGEWSDASSVHSNDLEDFWFSDKDDGLPTRGDTGNESNTSSAPVSRNNSVGSHLTVPGKRKPSAKRQGKKLYVCTYCQKNFSCSSNKKRHERVHSGGKAVDCKQCGVSAVLTSTQLLISSRHPLTFLFPSSRETLRVRSLWQGLLELEQSPQTRKDVSHASRIVWSASQQSSARKQRCPWDS
jgi:hypothetical protein